MAIDGQTAEAPASRWSLLCLLCLHVTIIFCTLTVAFAAAGRFFSLVASVLAAFADFSTTTVVLRLTLATMLSLLVLSDTLSLPDVVTAKTGLAKLSLKAMRKGMSILAAGATHTNKASRRLISPPLRHAAKLKRAVGRVVSTNKFASLLASAPLTPFKAMRGATIGLTRIISKGVDAPDATEQGNADVSVMMMIRAARLLQDYYSFQKMRHRTLRREALLRDGSLRFWSHVQHGGTRHRPARFIRVASDQRKLARPMREQPGSTRLGSQRPMASRGEDQLAEDDGVISIPPLHLSTG